MPRELSAGAADSAASEVTAQALAAAPEQGMAETIAARFVPHIPARIHPNTITLVTHAMNWLTACLAFSSAYTRGLTRSSLLLGAAVGMLVSVIGDCLDGMHARRTNQCTNLGSMLDHWLDAAVVPLVPAGITVALYMMPWQIVAVCITAAMVYHSQLLYYHHTGAFIAPEAATGSGAQLGVSAGYVAMAGLFYFVDPDTTWIRVLVYGIALLGLYIQMRCNWFYYKRLGAHVRGHLPFVLIGSAFGALHLLGAIDLNAFLLCIIFVSFRISGSYVLWTLVGRAYAGFDAGVAAWIGAIAAGHWLLAPVELGGVTIQWLLPYLVCAYCVVRNLVDFSRNYSALVAGRTLA